MQELSVKTLNQTIEAQLSEKETVQALVTTIFKDFQLPLMKQALLEGMMRGFSFKNFLDKDVYAIKYGNNYSLVSSIDYSRKIAMQTGEYAGKTEPLYEDDANGRPKTCSVTVKRLKNGQVFDFSAKVYVSEYTTAKNQWAIRPRTMIAKVAEQHALRMAFPEELSKAYIEEETERTATPQKPIVENEIDYIGIQSQFDVCDTVEAIREVFSKLPKEARSEKSVVDMAKSRKEELSVKEAEVDDDIPVITAKSTK